MPKGATLIRLAAHVLAVIPLGNLLWEASQNRLGTDPATYVVHELGFWGLVLLWSSLAMTPLRILLKQPVWVSARRPLGLWSFLYICLHLASFLVAWCGLDPVILKEELLERPYILLGALAWLLMLPLAATSPKVTRRQLGKRWIVLHRLVYGVAVLALLHVSLAAKLEYVKPLAFGILLIFLFFIRIRARQAKAGSIKCAPSA